MNQFAKPNRKKLRRYRHGFTMLEQIGLISLTATMIMMTGTTIHETFKLTRRLSDRRECHLALSSLRRDFQNDVWLSRSMRLDEESQNLRLQLLSGESKSYQISGSTMAVNTLQDSAVTDREIYDVGDGFSIEWDANKLPDDISIVVHRLTLPASDDVPDKLQTSTPEMRFGARLNRYSANLRFGPPLGDRK